MSEDYRGKEIDDQHAVVEKLMLALTEAADSGQFTTALEAVVEAVQRIYDDLCCGGTHSQAAEERVRWKPWETRPRDGRLVLALFPDREWVESVRSLPDGWAFGCDGDRAQDDPTHWMLMPEGPDGCEALREGNVRKGGLNTPPTNERPPTSPPGQGGRAMSERNKKTRELVDDEVSRFATLCPRCGDFLLFIGEDYWCENSCCDLRSVDSKDDMNWPEETER